MPQATKYSHSPVHSEMKPEFSDLHVMLNSIRVILTHIAMSTQNHLLEGTLEIKSQVLGCLPIYGIETQHDFLRQPLKPPLTTCLANISLLNGVFLGETKMARRVTENCLNLRRIFLTLAVVSFSTYQVPVFEKFNSQF